MQGSRARQDINTALTKYESVIQYGNISIGDNVKESQRLGSGWDVAGFVAMVAPGRPWDYKSADEFRGFQDNGLLAEFGNFHFGLVAHAFGFSKGIAIAGGGSVQTLSQHHASGYRFSGIANFSGSLAVLMIQPVNLVLYGYSDRMADFGAEIGLRFGDYPEDTSAIISGYDYYSAHYER